MELTPFFSGIALDVTPQISEDGYVTLHVHPSVSLVVDQQKTIEVAGITQTLPLALSTVREADSIVRAKSARDTDQCLGELASPDPGTIEGGKWYFDTSQGVLVYRVEAEDYFETALGGPKRARFRVKLDYEDRNQNQRFDSGQDRFLNVSLEVVEDLRALGTPPTSNIGQRGKLHA